MIMDTMLFTIYNLCLSLMINTPMEHQTNKSVLYNTDSLKIQGVITDEKKDSICGALIYVKELDINTYSNIEGYYKIDISKTNYHIDSLTIICEYFGSKSEVRIKNSTKNLNIKITEKDFDLDKCTIKKQLIK